MPLLQTVRDRALSVWQSAANQAAASLTGAALAAARSNPWAAAASAYAVHRDMGLPAAAAAPALPAGALQVWHCVDLTFRLAWARAQQDDQGAQLLTEQLQQFGACDMKWVSETVAQFLRDFPRNQKDIPYVAGLDNVLPLDLPAQATVALIGDWGTGTDAARALLAQVARKRPHLVLHLGDIYYSGTPEECQRFLGNVRAALGDGVPVLTLSGNHDMYSGGAGYYGLVGQLGQRASYFCLRNDDWQFLAMDTGYNDFNPFDVDTHAPGLTLSESAWHVGQIRQAGARKTVLLSHHPLFSAFEPIAGGKVNAELLRIFKDVLGDVALWFWGHEHRLDIYGPCALPTDGGSVTLQRGRCLGCSAIPVPVAENFFTPQFPDVPLLRDDRTGLPVRLSNDGAVYGLAYAVLQLDGPRATVSYYEDRDEANPLFVETIP